MCDEMIRSLRASMAEEGYHPGAPSLEAEVTDAQACNDTRCECGAYGLLYVPFMMDESYRAFAVCPVCGKRTEF